MTPLIEAVGEGFEDIVRLLLQQSADTNIKTIQVPSLHPYFRKKGGLIWFNYHDCATVPHQRAESCVRERQSAHREVTA